MGTVVDIPGVADVAEIMDEREGSIGQITVGGVVQVTGKTSSDIEVASVGDG